MRPDDLLSDLQANCETEGRAAKADAAKANNHTEKENQAINNQDQKPSYLDPKHPTGSKSDETEESLQIIS